MQYAVDPFGADDELQSEEDEWDSEQVCRCRDVQVEGMVVGAKKVKQAHFRAVRVVSDQKYQAFCSEETENQQEVFADSNQVVFYSLIDFYCYVTGHYGSCVGDRGRYFSFSGIE